MKVSCVSIAEFIEVLKDEEKIYRDIIRVSINRTGVDKPGRDATKFQVGILATTLVQVGEDEEYLLEAGEICGRDLESEDTDNSGSKRASQLKMKIVEFADTRNWKVKPGIISE